MTGNSSDFDELTKRADEMKHVEDQRDLQHEIAGVYTGRNSRFIAGAANSQKSLSEKRRAQQMADNDAFYIALMQDGAFGGFVASEVFDGKSDLEIADIVAEIETKTGLGLEDYAAGIIGVEASTRRTGESEADYKRRIIKAVAEEMVDPVTGQIKAQYADDPLAGIIQRDATYQAIMGDVAHINLTGQTAQANAVVASHKNAGYDEAKHAGFNIEDDQYRGELREGQHNHTDLATDGDKLADESGDFFGSPDNTAKASEAALREFNIKATEQTAQAAVPATALNVSLGSTST